VKAAATGRYDKISSSSEPASFLACRFICQPFNGVMPRFLTAGQAARIHSTPLRMRGILRVLATGAYPVLARITLSGMATKQSNSPTEGIKYEDS
jgi:hypothetical protein